jgi:transcription antitermination protein NusB
MLAPPGVAALWVWKVGNVVSVEPKQQQRPISPRSAARLAAVQALYQMDLAQTDVNAVIAEFTLHRFGQEVDGAFYDKLAQPFFKDIVTGVVHEQRRIDPLLNEHLAEGWRLSRLDSILRAILRAAAYELIGCPDVPAKVVINEYLNVAHAFFEGEEPGVVNGVLDRVARKVRVKELNGQVAH